MSGSTARCTRSGRHNTSTRLKQSATHQSAAAAQHMRQQQREREQLGRMDQRTPRKKVGDNGTHHDRTSAKL
jgi:hypothetical protein